MTTPAVLQLSGALTELRNNFAELPLDGPIGWLLVGFFGVAIPAGPWVLLQGVRKFRHGYAMFANESVGAGEAHQEAGVVEVEGTAAPLEGTIPGKYSDEPALAQKWHRERKREQTDDDGSTSTSWRTVDRGSDAVPFLVEDETGAVAVDPAGASLSITESRLHSEDELRIRDRDYREYEGRIEPGDSVYVYGQLRKADDPEGAPGEQRTYVGNGDDVPEFVISDSGQLGTVFDYFIQGALITSVGIGVILIAPLLFLFALEEAFGVPTASWLFDLL